MMLWSMVTAGIQLLLFVAGLTNLAVLYFIASTRKLRTVSNVQIFSLCLACFLYCSCLPFIVVLQLRSDWPFGLLACKVVYGLEVLAKTASIAFVMWASVERYLSVCWPDIRRNVWTLRSSVIISVVTWLFCSALMSPIFLWTKTGQMTNNITLTFSHNHTINQHTDCGVEWPDENSGASYLKTHFAVYTFVFLFVFPVIVIVFCYFRIMSIICQSNAKFQPPKSASPDDDKKHTRKLVQYTRSRSGRTGMETVTLISLRYTNHKDKGGNETDKLRKRSHRSRTYRRVTKMVIVIVSLFLVCWSPFWLMNFLIVCRVIQPGNDSEASRVVFRLVHILPLINCAITPYLYGFLTENFKQAVSSRCFCVRQKTTTGDKLSVTYSFSAPKPSTYLQSGSVYRPSTSDAIKTNDGINKTEQGTPCAEAVVHSSESDGINQKNIK